MKVISNYKTTLSASMTSSQLTVPVTSITTTDGHTITAADFDSVAYLVIEPGSENMEIVKVTGLTGSNFDVSVRGLAFYGNTETAVPANQKAHQSGSTVIMSNSHYYFDKMMDLDSAETVTGVKTFTASPIVPTPINPTEAANKDYIDNVAIAGGADASTTIKGISKLSSNPAVATEPVALNSEEVSATSAANKVVRANGDGKIDVGFIDQNEDYAWTGIQDFSGATIVGADLLGIYGDGSDGDVVISSNTSLSRDMHYNNLTINDSIVLNSNGFKIYISGTLNTIGTGKIASNGGAGGNGTNASGATNGVPGSAGAIAYANGGTLPNSLPGLAGGAVTTTIGTNGTNGISVTRTLSPNNAAAGGNSGQSRSDVTIPANTGGTAGIATSAPLTKPYAVSSMSQFYDLISGTLIPYTNVPSSGSGASGTNSGWGGGEGGAGGGGGSGASGGFVWIAANTITNLNVEAIGGDGGNGGNGTTSTHYGGAGGGGGGGNGGIILVYYNTKTTITASAAGGTGGAGGTGSSAGSPGENGNNGLVKEINM